MKFAIYLITAIVFLPLARANEPLPPNVQRLIDQRAAAIAKIDKQYVQELEKIKVFYTKQGNLEGANVVVDLIKQISPQVRITSAADLKTFLMGTVWHWSSSPTGSAPVKLEFYGDGTYNIAVDSKRHPWVAQSPTTVQIVEGTVLFSSDYESFVAEVSGGQKRYGRKIGPK